MSGIFISYRRADSDGWAGRLRDTLRARFGDLVFQDVDNIGDGEIFSEVIDRALQTCNVALIVIGPNWATARDEQGRRLDHEEDWVRTETAMVLNRKIRVIPVLVGGASLPRAEDLPEELRSLTKRQARQIRSNSWDADVGLLTRQLEQIVGPTRKRPAWLYALPLLVILVGIGVYAGSRFLGQPAPSPDRAEPSAAAVPGAAVKRDEPTRAPPDVAAPAPGSVSDAPKDKQPEIAAPVKAEPPPAPPKEVASSQASTAPPKSKPPPPSKSPASPPSAAERDQPRIAKPASKTEPAPAREEIAAPAREPPRRRAAAQPEGDTPSDRAPAPAAPKAAVETAAPSGTLNLPNRPASSRALRIGDSWTYRLREVRFNKNLATVTHEISGGDAGSIRETIASVGSSRGASERRLALEPRIFEQPLAGGAALFEFAPFMTAFSELQPGVTWTKIAGAASSDSVNEWRFSGKVSGREKVGVPAGNFDAIKVELEGQLNISSPTTLDVSRETTPAYQTYSVWFVPEVGRAVKYVRRTFNRSRLLLDHEQYELVSYQQK